MSFEEQDFDENPENPEDFYDSDEDSNQDQKEEAEQMKKQIPEWRRGKLTRDQNVLRRIRFLASRDEKEAIKKSEGHLVGILEQLAREALAAPLSSFE